jgi:AcrR family transcriptional regulator
MTVTSSAGEREMILRGVENLAASEGYDALTLPHIRQRVGIPRRRFEEHFADVEECFIAALEFRVKSSLTASWSEALRASPWPGGVYRAIAGLCEALAEDRSLNRLLFLELLNAGREAARWRAEFLSHLSSSLRASAPTQERPSILTAETSMAAVWTLLESCGVRGQARHPMQLVGPAAYLILAPAIGADAAVEAVQRERAAETARLR